MSFFTPTTRVVEIDAENSVTIRKLTYDERQSIMSESTKKADMSNNHMGLMIRDKATRKAIVSWTGPGFEDRPVTPENIGLLPSEVSEVVADAVQEFSMGIKVDEKKALTEP